LDSAEVEAEGTADEPQAGNYIIWRGPPSAEWRGWLFPRYGSLAPQKKVAFSRQFGYIFKKLFPLHLLINLTDFKHMTTYSQVVQYVITGITIGGIYALIALGFSIIYNTTGIINFAQGEFVMLGGMIAVSLATAGLPLLWAFLLSVLLVTAVGLLFERLAIHPLKGASIITLIIITIGASIFLKGVAMLIWGKDAVRLPSFSGDKPYHILGATILPQHLWILGITLSVMLLLHLFFEYTILGKAMRASAANRLAASLVGINVRKMAMCSFALSAAIGAVAGIIISPVTFSSYDVGTMLGLKGFCAAIIGGLGSSPGAILGGFLLGILESLGAGFLSSSYKDATAFCILLTVLFLRPRGILGRP